MATIYKTPEGAFFEKTDKGYAGVNDPNVLKGLYSGSITAVPFTDYKNAATQYSSVPTTPSLIPKPIQVSQPQPQGDPMSRLSTGIMDMLKNAQVKQQEAEAQKAGLQRESFAAGQTQFTGEDARTLSPDAKMNALQNETKMYSPSIDALSTRIKQMGDIMDLMKTTYGEDFNKLLPPTEEEAAVVKDAMRNGMTVPFEQVQRVSKWLTQADWAEFAKNKTETSTTPKSRYPTSISTGLFGESKTVMFDPNTGKIYDIYTGEELEKPAEETPLNINKETKTTGNIENAVDFVKSWFSKKP